MKPASSMETNVGVLTEGQVISDYNMQTNEPGRHSASTFSIKVTWKI